MEALLRLRSKDTKWLDYGPDEYAGITWSNTGERKIFLGWMSNWMYANQVPSVKWRNAVTIPRDLKIIEAGNKLYVASTPVEELKKIEASSISKENYKIKRSSNLSDLIKEFSLPSRINISMKKIKDFSISLSNGSGEKLVIGYDKNLNQYFIDRTMAGKSDFNKEFAEKHIAPRFSKNKNMDLSLIIDESSVELFADDGLSVMTEIFFPEKPYNQIQVQTPKKLLFEKIQYIEYKSIWH